MRNDKILRLRTITSDKLCQFFAIVLIKRGINFIQHIEARRLVLLQSEQERKRSHSLLTAAQSTNVQEFVPYKFDIDRQTTRERILQVLQIKIRFALSHQLLENTHKLLIDNIESLHEQILLASLNLIHHLHNIIALAQQNFLFLSKTRVFLFNSIINVERAQVHTADICHHTLEIINLLLELLFGFFHIKLDASVMLELRLQSGELSLDSSLFNRESIEREFLLARLLLNVKNFRLMSIHFIRKLIAPCEQLLELTEKHFLLGFFFLQLNI